jgi:Outer membrane lipoprotein-sorting protein
MAVSPGQGQPKAEIRQPNRVDAAEGEKEARKLVANLLAQQPHHNTTNTGVLEILDQEDHERRVPIRFTLLASGTKTVSIYESLGSAREVLTVNHWPESTNQYELSINGTRRTLSSNQIMVPFAGSDFWIADLGLEFLHWPTQRVIKKEMRKGQFCYVLESVNPNPANGYKRVDSWIAVNREGIVIVHADAFDARDKLMKQFDPRAVEKVQGAWELQEMEMRNSQTDSRTRIKFNLEP